MHIMKLSAVILFISILFGCRPAGRPQVPMHAAPAVQPAAQPAGAPPATQAEPADNDIVGILKRRFGAPSRISMGKELKVATMVYEVENGQKLVFHLEDDQIDRVTVLVPGERIKRRRAPRPKTKEQPPPPVQAPPKDASEMKPDF